MPAKSATSAPVETYNLTVDLLEGNIRSGRGDNTYLITESRSWSYAEVVAAARAASAGLLERGLVAGDRVVLAVGDGPEFVITFWGAIRAGIVPIPIAQGLSLSDVRFILNDSEARALICDQPSASTAGRAALDTGVLTFYAGDDVPHQMVRWSDLAEADARLIDPLTKDDDIVLWLYTSGTTGLPKAAMHTHHSVRSATLGIARQVLNMDEHDVVLSVSRMFFAYGLGNSVYLPASVGASVILNEGPVLPARIAELLSKFSPTLLFGVPGFLDGFSRLEGASLPSSVRAVLSAGEALGPALLERFQTSFRQPVLDGIGATEMLHHVTCTRPNDVVPGSAGRALDGYEIQVRDRAGEVVPEGISGELWVKGPSQFAGYWRRPELTDRVRRGEWVRTGDQVRIVDGRLYHEGRLDDLIKLGGVWVSPVEVEEVLRSHPDVIDAAVVATDDGSGVPRIKAFVLSEGDERKLRDELRALCRRRLATFKIPRSFEVVTELPRTPTGKLRRFVLRGPH